MKAFNNRHLLLSGLITLACTHTSMVMAAEVSVRDLSQPHSLSSIDAERNDARGGRGGGNPPPPPPPAPPPAPPGPAPAPAPAPGPNGDINAQLRTIIDQRQLAIDPTAGRDLPGVDDVMVQLGKSLFFAKNLGGDNQTSCASCHHPVLGGGDDLSLPVGVEAVNAAGEASPDLLGHGRFHDNDDANRPIIGRNSPTVFNVGLNDQSMFWDSRIQAVRPVEGRNGMADVIITPDSVVNADGRRLPDRTLPAGTSLPAAQARFPVTSLSEMRNGFAPDADNQTLRGALASRFDNSDVDYQSSWPALFALAFPDGEINFDRMAMAIGEYERSMVFVDNPWSAYVAGDNEALSEQQKQGALLFFTPPQQGGAGCAGCHNGPTFSDNRQHLTAFPQIGSGDDLGREQVTGDERDRYHFRTASLLNVAVTAPYGHSGAYQTLEQVIRHYTNPGRNVDRLFGAVQGRPFEAAVTPLCQSPQLAGIAAKNDLTCDEVYPQAFEHSRSALQRLQQARNGQVEARAPLPGNVRLDNNDVQALVAFLNALTDPCVLSAECLQPWIIDGDDVATYPDNNPLVGVNAQGDAL